MGQQTEQDTLVSAGKPNQLPPEPPSVVAGALFSRMSPREQQMLRTVFVVRSTARQMDHAVSEWMADSAASPARFQILSLLWAAKKRGVPHKEIVAALGVTRATISGLMAGLERDGLVTSAEDIGDRRSVLAGLTRKGEAVVEKAIESNKAKLRTVFGGLSPDELTTLTTLLERVRQGVSGSADAANSKKRRAD